MIEGIIWAVSAGIMLGLYALPEKFTKEFEFENTWGTFFTTALFVVPLIAVMLLVNGFGAIMSAIPAEVYVKMAIASILWGVGVMMWGKAINHIGLSLGFSIFIGTIILVGSLLPFIVDGLPATKALITILLGIFVVLIGVILNGRAGMIRHNAETSDQAEGEQKGSMVTGIIIAVVGGLLATGFSFANAVGNPASDSTKQYIKNALIEQGNPEWMLAIIIMFIIYVAGGLFVTPYFIVQLSKKKLWGNFKTAHLGKNLVMTSLMAVLNFAASASFAYAAFALGSAGNTVGYAIFNAISVAVAIIGGLLTGEWTKAPSKAKSSLYLGLALMICGVIIVAIGNGLA